MGLEEVRIEYRPDETIGCLCARIVRQPYSLPSLYVGPWNYKHELPRVQADGTIVVWHAASCAYGAELGEWEDEIAS